MKKITKRLLSLLLVLVFAFSAISVVEATQSKYENYSKNFTLTGNGATDIVNVAVAQLGKTKANLGYTEAWCADFVGDCAKLAGESEAVPLQGGVSYLKNAVINAGGKIVDSRQKGDLVFYYCKTCAAWPHVGIVLDSEYSIEGNVSGQVYKVGGYEQYVDSKGHKVSSGTITKTYIRPNYSNNNDVTISFAFPTDSEYSSKYYIGGTNAVLVNKVTRSGVTSMQTGGMYLYDYNGNYIDHISWDVSKISINPFHIWCDVNGELGQTLVPGTRYRYKFFLVANNKTFYSDSYYFDTQGSYTLTFNPNGGTVDKTTMSCTRGVWLGTLPTPKRNGYVFDGWYTAANGGTQITSSTAYTATSNMTVYAHWSPAPITSISIAKTPNATTFYVVDTLDTTGLWLYVNRSDGSFEIVQSGFTCSPTKFSSAGTQTITVTYAGKTTTYNVTVKELEPVVVLFTTRFMVDSNLYFEKSYKSGTAVSIPDAPQKEGYTFVKWSPDVPTYMPEQNMTFTAVFEKNEEPPVIDPPVVNPPVADNITLAVRNPSTTTINYGDSIILHADIEGELPAGAYIEWTTSNGNFEFDALNDGTCKITPSSSGDTTFTATIYDAEGKVIGTDEQVITSKAGFFQKIIAFFKSIFGLTKTIPQLYRSMI